MGRAGHNAPDPLRDPVHGRVYRITYPSRPLVQPAEVANAPISTLLENLDKKNTHYEHHLLEVLGVTWGLNKVNVNILLQLLKAEDYRARAAAVQVLRYSGHQVENPENIRPLLLHFIWMNIGKRKN